MNIQDIIKNQDILDCWKEIQKSNADKNISKEVFEYDIEEYHTFLLEEIIEASQYMNISFDALINEMFSFVKDNKSLLINFSIFNWFSKRNSILELLGLARLTVL